MTFNWTPEEEARYEAYRKRTVSRNITTKIDFIKALREVTGFGLKQCVDITNALISKGVLNVKD